MFQPIKHLNNYDRFKLAKLVNGSVVIEFNLGLQMADSVLTLAEKILNIEFEIC